MKRIINIPRHDWREKVESLGFSFHTDLLDNEKYWHEEASYEFTEKEVDVLWDAAEELHEMCLKAVDHIVTNNLFNKMQIPQEFHELIKASWNRQDPTIYGRFDFSYDGSAPPKMLEYNADTPTSLLEASVIQWDWLEDVYPGTDQFNSLHEDLIECWKSLNPGKPVYFSTVEDTLEDIITTEYMMDVAIQGGIDARWIAIEDIGSDGENFFDLDMERIEYLFKLYPWEWMVREDFGKALVLETINLMEPAWKMLLSNKAILPILWELFPGHPNLLPAYFDEDKLSTYAKKPIFGREGADIEIVGAGRVKLNEQGNYGKEGFIYQEYYPLPNFDGKYPVLGVWMVGHKPAGLGIREDANLVTSDGSHFTPHYFNKGEKNEGS